MSWWAAHLMCSRFLLQGTSRPTRSQSTAQLVQPSGGLQASVISSVVLMKGQAKVRKGHRQHELLNGTRSEALSCGRREGGRRAGEAGSRHRC